MKSRVYGNVTKRKLYKIVSLVIIFAVILGCLNTFGTERVEAASKVKLNVKNTSMAVGDTLQLSVKGTKKKVKVTWKSSNKKVATVSKKGVIKAKKAGTVKITAIIKGKGINVKRTAKIKVIARGTFYRDKLRKYLKKKGKKRTLTDNDPVTEKDYTYHTYTIELNVNRDEGGEEDNHVMLASIAFNDYDNYITFDVIDSIEEPPFSEHLYMCVNKSIKTKVYFSGDLEDGYSDDSLSLDGNINKKYDANGKGIKWTSCSVIYADESSDDSEETSTAKPSEKENLKKYSGRGDELLKNGFKLWDQIMKDAGITMSDIGYTKYTSETEE